MARRSTITMLPSANLPSAELAAGPLLELIRTIRAPRVAAITTNIAKSAEVGVTYASTLCQNSAADL